jgi:DNA repair protein RecN (Recombination protein N)
MALRRMVLSDFVIVSHLSVDWQAGFSVLTGETGAGKSILIDALQLALGERASSSVVREGTARAEISVSFDPPIAAVLSFLDEAGIPCDADEELLLRRQIDAQGKSRAWINGVSATTAQLRALGEYLVDIHGQHAWQSLIRPAAVSDLLDAYGAIDTHDLKQAWHAWSQAQTNWEQAQRDQGQSEQEREQLQWHLQALDELGLAPGQWEDWQKQQHRLAHAQALVQGALTVEEALRSASFNALDFIDQAQRALQPHLTIEPTWQGWVDSLAQADALIADVAREAKNYAQHTQADPQALAWLDERLAKAMALARRLKCTPEALPLEQAAFRTRLAQLDVGLDLDALCTQATQAGKHYQDLAQKITQARAEAAAHLAQAVTQQMQDLGMSGGRLEVHLVPLSKPGVHGLEDVQLSMAAHSGVSVQPLSKVASGGELSRLALAMAVVTAQASERSHAAVATVVFDEIDSGIGGQVAHTVGRLMRTLGQEKQVLAVTHLAQVAAYAHHHHVVSKFQEGSSTRSQLIEVTETARQAEIARMMGGHPDEPASLAHAQATLAKAQAT